MLLMVALLGYILPLLGFLSELGQVVFPCGGQRRVGTGLKSGGFWDSQVSAGETGTQPESSRQRRCRVRAEDTQVGARMWRHWRALCHCSQ